MNDIKIYPYGPLGSNMYIVSHEDGLIVIDPSVSPADRHFLKHDPDFDPSKVMAVFMTHGHFDHCAHLDDWSLATGAPCYIASEDMDLLKDPSVNCSADFDVPLTYRTEPLVFEKCSIKGFEIIKTPGHTPGSVCMLYNNSFLFSGDTLFRGSMGRVDLPGGDPKAMESSLKALCKLPDDITVFPGHGPYTTMAIEKKYNPYL